MKPSLNAASYKVQNIDNESVDLNLASMSKQETIVPQTLFSK